MIYDAFLFFNELDLLELRLNYLNDVVDYFVISECDYTFSGLPKKFYFDEVKNEPRFSKFLNKIIHIKNYNTIEIEIPTTNNDINTFKNILTHYYSIKNTPETDNGAPHWCRDFLHREFVSFGLVNCKDSDIIIFGDVDEFPDKTKLEYKNTPYIFEMKHIQGAFDVENKSEPFQGTLVTTYSELKQNSLGQYRNKKRYNGFRKVYGGWHLTSMGGPDRVKTKIRSWGHQELARPDILNNVEYALANGKDIFGRGHRLEKINMIECYGEELYGYLNKLSLI